MTIGNRLRTFRKRQGLTIKNVADAVGVPPTTYRDWEYGKAIQGEPYGELAKILKVPLAYLVTGEEFDPASISTQIDEIIGQLKTIRDHMLKSQ